MDRVLSKVSLLLRQFILKQTSIEDVVGLCQMKGNNVQSRDLIVNIDYELGKQAVAVYFQLFCKF